MGGSTDRKGRVEVCVGGRWWTAREAGLVHVCSRLGYVTLNAETSQPCDGATTEKTSQLNNETTTNSSITQSTVMSTSGTLGALIGLLAAALVVVVTGWIVSCVYFQRKINK